MFKFFGILVDGGWSLWSAWSECTRKCPQSVPQKLKTRLCNNPTPQDGGKGCVGQMTKTEACDSTMFCGMCYFAFIFYGRVGHVLDRVSLEYNTYDNA